MRGAPTPLGQRVKDRRRELGLTLAQVGDRLGLANGNFIGMVERGERTPSDGKLLELAGVLELDQRTLLTLKYATSASSAVSDLLAPPPPELPRLRRFLLGTCANPKPMTRELERGERTAIERVIWQGLLEYVVLPELDRDRHAPRRLRDRIDRWNRRRRTDETLAVDPWWFEEEAEVFVPWARSRFHSWDLDLPTLTLRIRHSASPTDVSTLPLVDRELRERMLRAVQADKAPRPTSLGDALRAEGLLEDDVDELLALIAIKKRRAERARVEG